MSELNAVNLAPKIFNIKGWIDQTDEAILKSTFDTVLQESHFKVLSYTDHQFPLNGFTAFWLLAESHLAIHTFTDSGWTYIELSSCNNEKALKFLTLCKKFNFNFRWEKEMEELNCEVLANT